MKRHQGWLLGAALTISAAMPLAHAQQTYSLEIKPQSLSGALTALAEQTGLQVVFFSEVADGQQAPELVGSYSVDQAMTALLADTDLVYQRLDENGSITVQRKDAPTGAPAGNEFAGAPGPDADPGINDTGEPTTESVTSQRREGIEEIIVTARRREESVQDVPISITALSAEDMKAFGVRNLADMEGIVPGLNMGGGGNGVKKDSNPFIRGVGQRETKVTLDPAVGTYIDGIFIARTAGAMFDVAGLESVEVLRGPQGTLFGRNTTGGAISLTTKKPTNDASASISSNVGNYGRSDVSLMVNAPLVPDQLFGRLTVASVNSDGYFTNINDGSTWGGDNRVTGIGQLRWLPADNLTFDVLGERTRVRETPRPQKCMVLRELNKTGRSDPTFDDYNPRYFNPRPVSTLDDNRAENGQLRMHELCYQSELLPNDQFGSDMAVGDPLLPKARYWVDTSTVGLTGTLDIGDLGPLSKTQLKSITAWRRVEQIADEDLDAVGAPYVVRMQSDFTKTSQFSQELQLNGAAFDDRLFFSTGLYYFTEETPEDRIHLLSGISQKVYYTLSGPEELLELEEAFDIDIPDDTRDLYQTMSYEPASEILRTKNDAYAWYGQIDFNVTPELQLTAGIRYTEETRWSRYEKAYVIPDSLVDGLFGALTVPGMNVFGGYVGGYNPMLDWRYGFNDAGWGTVGGVIEGRYAGDELEITDRAWTPMASVKYSASPALLDRLNLNNAMAYLTYSEGFHSGGVTAGAIDTNVVGEPGYPAADPIRFKPEIVKNYELGLKLQALDRRVQANLAVFYMDYTDIQLSSAGVRDGVPIPFIENAGKAVIKGVESEFVVMPLPGWRVVANASWTDADIKEWDAAQYSLDTFTGEIIGEVTYLNRSDEPMPRVAEWQAFLMTDFSIQMGNLGTLTPSVAGRYTSEIYHGFDRGSYCFTVGGCELSKVPGLSAISEPLPERELSDGRVLRDRKDALFSEAVIFLDARLTWLSVDGSLEIAAWGKNLTNIDDYLVGGIPLADVTGATGLVFANPRTFGLTMTYNFGAR
jgi:outer membrane receptor protein involved in Fe transport